MENSESSTFYVESVYCNDFVIFLSKISVVYVFNSSPKHTMLLWS